ncbi:FxsA family protein [Dongia soli]|uniref:FxsA family protein n=1 Tax=Dongia soli TaxID=600628 RepID=A0ABU5E825_9PROT|nr:FxsA family protein [Dongia soli]MDY0881991.1 FxsA family protein [Dongia soli]
MARRSGPDRHKRGRQNGRGIPARALPGLISLGFILLVVLEIVGFVWVADIIGIALTLLAVLGSAFLGLWLIRRSGLDMIGRLRLALAQGQEPGHSLVDGACFVAAGLLLILPGFFSDLMALLVILPATRNWLIRRLARYFDLRTAAGRTAGGTTVIYDAEYREVATEAEETPEPPGQAAEVLEPRHQPGERKKRNGEPRRPIIDIEDDK